MIVHTNEFSEKYTLVKQSLAEFSEKFGKKVKERRKALGITQRVLVQMLQECGISVSQGYISLIEGKGRQEPNIKIIIAIAILLEISLDEILSGD